MGILAATLSNLFRGKGPRATAQDFNPFKPKPRRIKAKASDDLLKKIEFINRTLGGKDLRDGTGR